MKYLMLMRHAKSSWKFPNLTDHDRPLNSRGRRDASRMGEFIDSIDRLPELILCSTAKRAQQTVDLFLQEVPFEGEFFFRRELYHSGSEEFVNELRQLDDQIENAMIVGHNPGMEYALEDFCGVEEIMPTASIALIKFDLIKWSYMTNETTGELVDLWRPKEINFKL